MATADGGVLAQPSNGSSNVTVDANGNPDHQHLSDRIQSQKFSIRFKRAIEMMSPLLSPLEL
jgi:hypothetical protein